MRVAAVFSIGASVGGAEYALGWLKKDGFCPDLYFYYGEPGENQRDASPLAALQEILKSSVVEGCRVVAQTASPAFSLDAAYQKANEVVKQIREAGYDRVYVGITGGTNPMVCALLSAAISQLGSRAIPLYVQGQPKGQGQESLRLVESVRIGEDLLLERVLNEARNSHFQAARSLSVDLAEEGPMGFVRKSMQALLAWDGFDYSARTLLQELKLRAADVAMDPRLGPLAKTISRYAELGEKLAEVEGLARDTDAYYKEWRSIPQKVKALMEHRGIWFALDALSNASRRLEQGHFADAVLRAYRGVELAVQNRLMRVGVHPSQLYWEESPLASFRGAWEAEKRSLHEVVSLEQGIRLLELLSGKEYRRTAAERKKLQHLRNMSYLEHGYLRPGKDQASSALDRAKAVTAEILEVELDGDFSLRRLRIEI